MGTKAAPPYANFFIGHQEETIRETFIWAIPFWKRFIDDIFLIFLGTTNQLQSLQNFMNHPHPTIKFILQHSIQQTSFLEIKVQVGENCKLSTTLFRKPTDCVALLHFHSNHSLRSKESIAFSQALRYSILIADDHLLQKELNSLAISLLAREYPLDNILHSISKALLHPRDTLLREPSKASGPTTVLPIITPYSVEGKSFSQSVRDKWHIIENDPQLYSIWPNHPITAYHKTESVKDILVHSRQAKPTYLWQKTTPKQNHLLTTSSHLPPHPFPSRFDFFRYVDQRLFLLKRPRTCLSNRRKLIQLSFAMWLSPTNQKPVIIQACNRRNHEAFQLTDIFPFTNLLLSQW